VWEAAGGDEAAVPHGKGESHRLWDGSLVFNSFAPSLLATIAHGSAQWRSTVTARWVVAAVKAM